MSTRPPSDAELERRLRAHYRDRFGDPPAPGALWTGVAARLEPRDAAAEAGYHVSPSLREIALEDIVGTETDAERRTRTVRSTRLDDHRPRGRGRAIAILGPIAAALVLAALVGAVLAQQARNRPSGTTTIIQRGQLNWQSVSLPDGLVFGSRGVAFMVAPSDGDVAYVCATSPSKPSAHPRLWATHDRAQHWARLADVPTMRDATGCDLGIDRNDPRLLTATAYPAGADGGAQAPPEQWQQFVSFDGGQSWSARVDGGSVFLLGGHFHATLNGRTYAVRDPLPLAEHPTSRLYVSDDQMRTWTEIDGPLLASAAVRALPANQQGIWNLWVHPTTGELLATVAGWQLWESHDGGAHWTQVDVRISAPAGQSTQDSLLPYQLYIAPPVVGQPWRICALMQLDVIQTDTAFPFACTSDGGKTWTTRLGLFYTPCFGGCAQVGSAHPGAVQPLGMLADGTVFGDDGALLSRLPPGATSEREWARLGEYPRASAGANDTNDQTNRSQGVTPSGELALWVFYKDGAGYTTTLR